jgi:site-specific DNA recombinase
MKQRAAIYARVSTDRQKESQTIGSQTAALKAYAAAHGYQVEAEWVFEDEGYSGAILLRPGLEGLRDLAAAGEIEAVLVYSPDRLSRKYAYQVLLAEEFARAGVELVFLNRPAGSSPEDRLMQQFQGMIAEYERAQIAERSRRGKRYKAQQGVVNVFSAAPYGYRYVRKTESAAAYYEVVEAEAQVVRWVFETYTGQAISLNGVTRLLNERQIPTRSGKPFWERSTIRGMLRNPAYQGLAGYGKTESRPRQKITRPLRQRQGLASQTTTNHERPRADWIGVPVPALVSAELFALAQTQLEQNQHHSPRRTIKPTLLQGMLVCQLCGYALYRTVSRRRTTANLYYYRCLGSEGQRWPRGAKCANRPVRQEALDQLVWDEFLRLVEQPTLMQTEIERRRELARHSDPLRKRQEDLRREQVRLENNIDRLVTAYQEQLLELAELRERLPSLRKQIQAVARELQALEMAALDDSRFLKLAETLTSFRAKLRSRADGLDVKERQRLLRLLVKEVLVGSDTITLCHSIPPAVDTFGAPGSAPPKPGAGLPRPDYSLCTRRSGSALP